MNDPATLIRFGISEFRQQLVWAHEKASAEGPEVDTEHIKTMCRALERRLAEIEGQLLSPSGEAEDDREKRSVAPLALVMLPNAGRAVAMRVHEAAQEWSRMTNNLMVQADQSLHYELLGMICMTAGVGICNAADLVHQAALGEYSSSVSS